MSINAIPLPLMNLLYSVIAATIKARCIRKSKFYSPYPISLSPLLLSSQNLVNLAAGASLSRGELALIARSLQSHLRQALYSQDRPKSA